MRFGLYMHLCICYIHSDVTHFTYTNTLISRLTLILILNIIKTEKLWSSPQTCVSCINSSAPQRLPQPEPCAVLTLTCPAHIIASCRPHFLTCSWTCPVPSMAPPPPLRTFALTQLTLSFHPDLGNTFLPGLPACGIVLFQVIFLRAAGVNF